MHNLLVYTYQNQMENKCFKYYKSQHNCSCIEMLSSLGYRNISSGKIKMRFWNTGSSKWYI